MDAIGWVQLARSRDQTFLHYYLKPKCFSSLALEFCTSQCNENLKKCKWRTSHPLCFPPNNLYLRALSKCNSVILGLAIAENHDYFSAMIALSFALLGITFLEKRSAKAVKYGRYRFKKFDLARV